MYSLDLLYILSTLTIFALFRSVIFRAIFEMVWLPDNFTICIVVVNFESTLIDESFMFCNIKQVYAAQQYFRLQEHIMVMHHTVNNLTVNKILGLRYDEWCKTAQKQ